jgi:K+-sensing histidine kinase KdpD
MTRSGTRRDGRGTTWEMSLAAPVEGPLAGLIAQLRRAPGAAYLGALLLVLASLIVRLLLSPMLTNGYGFTVFYPAVILSAYWLGGRPALLATGLSAAIVYTFMGPAPLSLHMEGRTAVSLSVFLVSSLLLIHVLSSIRTRFSDLARSHARVEALATGQAELFREHAQRTTDHLQLIAAILQVKARGEGDPAVSRVLTNAASRTLVISRAHRAFAGGEDRTVDFEAFARKLVEAAAGRGGLAEARVQFGGDGVETPVEQATALGLVLLEYLTTLQTATPDATLAISLAEADGVRTLNLTALGVEALPGPRDMLLVEAMTEQLGGRLLVTRGDGACDVRIAFPSALQPPPAWDPLTFSLH